MVLVDQSSVRSRWLDIGQVLYSRMYGPKQSGRVHKKHFQKLEETNTGFAKVVVHDVLTLQVTKLTKVGEEKN